jgi:hypothetical protein
MSFHAARTVAAAISVAAELSITPRRPTRSAIERTQSKATIVPHAKTA